MEEVKGSVSGCSVTLPGQALLRVRERAMDLRVILDKGAADSTYRIIKLYLVHLLLSLMPDRRL